MTFSKADEVHLLHRKDGPRDPEGPLCDRYSAAGLVLGTGTKGVSAGTIECLGKGWAAVSVLARKAGTYGRTAEPSRQPTDREMAWTSETRFYVARDSRISVQAVR